MELIIFFVLGAAIGSFINAASFRIAEGKNWVSDRSECPKCKQDLKWYQLIPIVSYLALRGKCGSCKTAISLQYLLVEIAMAFLFLQAGQAWMLSGDYIELLFALILFTSLTFLFIHDLRYYILPDIVTLPTLVALMGLQLYMGMDWNLLFLAVFIGSGFFAFQFLISKGRWIGGGDIRMGALMGAAIGWPYILVGLMLSYLSGSFIAIFLLLSKKKAVGAKIPFGTFLALGTLATYWWGAPIWSWYIGFL
jgi:leader peptidase (prepilin peptidase) / N-methyltransferase